MDLDLQLKQFGSGIPERTNVLVGGSSSSGKTMFATHVALKAAQAGLKVAYVDADHSFIKGPCSFFISEMLRQAPPESIAYQGVADLKPYEDSGIIALVKRLIELADVVILDELPRIHFMAEDAGTAAGWKDTVRVLNQFIKDENSKPRRTVVTYSARELPKKPVVVGESEPLPSWPGMPRQVVPVVMAQRNPETYLMAVEMVRV